MEGAVAIADRLARAARQPADEGLATVLLSPAAASFDMYPDYVARGRAFKSAVRALVAAHAPDLERGPSSGSASGAAR